jgi:hypothetical protein
LIYDCNYYRKEKEGAGMFEAFGFGIVPFLVSWCLAYGIYRGVTQKKIKNLPQGISLLSTAAIMSYCVSVQKPMTFSMAFGSAVVAAGVSILIVSKLFKPVGAD